MLENDDGPPDEARLFLPHLKNRGPVTAVSGTRCSLSLVLVRLEVRSSPRMSAGTSDRDFLEVKNRLIVGPERGFGHRLGDRPLYREIAGRIHVHAVGAVENVQRFAPVMKARSTAPSASLLMSVFDLLQHQIDGGQRIEPMLRNTSERMRGA